MFSPRSVSDTDPVCRVPDPVPVLGCRTFGRGNLIGKVMRFDENNYSGSGGSMLHHVKD